MAGKRLILFLNLAFIALVALITAYLTRHYVFTLAALYHNTEPPPSCSDEAAYQPMVSVMIPARNEEQVIERIHQSN